MQNVLFVFCFFSDSKCEATTYLDSLTIITMDEPCIDKTLDTLAETSMPMETEAASGGHEDESVSLKNSSNKQATELAIDCTSIDADNSDVCGSSGRLDPSHKIRMLARVAVSNAHFKHQQRGEPELNLEEKIEIAQTVLDSSKANFLSKFWSYLEIEDIEVFQDSKHEYEIDFYIKQILKSKNTVFQQKRVKNRRFVAMKELISEGDYFSEDEMKFREPYLYDQMIGQYLSDDEIKAKVDKTDLTFSNILLKHIDQLDENVRFGNAKDVEVTFFCYNRFCIRKTTMH